MKNAHTISQRCPKPREMLVGKPPRLVLTEIHCDQWLRCPIHGGCVVCGWTGSVTTSWGVTTPCACMEGIR